MKRLRFAIIALAGLVLVAAPGWPQDEKPEEKPYDQTIDHVYAKLDGKDFHMDIFVPNGKGLKDFYKPTDKGRGLGIVDVASGAWYSDRGKIADHEQAMVYHILCAHGYTVFAVRPGSRPEYSALEMVAHIKRGIRYVKVHAKDYGIDPERLGIMGASAGGHLACLTVLTAEDGDPKAEDPLLRQDTRVKAAGIFFPPTDFLDWEGKTFEEVVERLGDIFFSGGFEGKSPEEIQRRAKTISPRHQITGKTPPFLIFHGDADPLVPLQQSQVFVEALKASGNEAELIVKAGGGHPWITIPMEVVKLAAWFDRQLAGGGDE